MRLGTWTLAISLLAASATPALAQQRRPMPPLGPGTDPTAVLRDPAIRQDLKLSEDQLKKLQEAVSKAIDENLTPEQAKRLKQIMLQQRGLDAFNEPRVKEALKLTEDQAEKIRGIREEMAEKMREAFQRGGGGNPREAFEKLRQLRKDMWDKAVNVLTDEQKKVWKDLAGEPFEPVRRGLPPTRRPNN
ncbi:MAG: hypothetical protein NZ700_15560 [Gemmataceae bacterium]|nr:hypothetical protein [Gemmataceae bacterium]MDW8263727.1 hypothetical protein [Gemmataceae bacterium]